MGSIVYYEMHATMEDAIKREKQLKKWNRAWKLRLIEEILNGKISSMNSGAQSPKGLRMLFVPDPERTRAEE